MSHPIYYDPLPAPLEWVVTPVSWDLDAGRLQITAGPLTDLFISPQGDAQTLNAPRLLGPISGDFQLSTRVTVDFRSTFDAGTLLVWRDEHTWAKFCFEYSPDREPMVVSVVTRSYSDDANGFSIDEPTIWLRVSRIGSALALHASRDGQRWSLIRHLHLDMGETPLVGFVAQSPTGAGCTVAFEDLRFRSERLAELRDGS
ncbi:MAG: DUF1349 domain-containing protein [Roseiflexaceae bacterium]